MLRAWEPTSCLWAPSTLSAWHAICWTHLKSCSWTRQLLLWTRTWTRTQLCSNCWRTTSRIPPSSRSLILWKSLSIMTASSSWTPFRILNPCSMSSAWTPAKLSLTSCLPGIQKTPCCPQHLPGHEQDCVLGHEDFTRIDQIATRLDSDQRKVFPRAGRKVQRKVNTWNGICPNFNSVF